MTSRLRRLTLVLTVLLALRGTAHGDSIFAMGNSLTWDSRPSLLDGDVQWHIACNRNLADAFDNPGETCIGSSTNWTSAFASKDYDYVMLQPFFGTSLTQDTEVISTIMDLEPHASIVVHTGWSTVNTLEQVYTSRLASEQMRPSADYFGRLLAGVRQAHPDRIIESDRVVDMLYSIATDIDAGRAPFRSLGELYRDGIHLNETGRYVAHNAVRLAMGQPISDEGFELAAATRRYLDGKILSVHSMPSTDSSDPAMSTSTDSHQSISLETDSVNPPTSPAPAFLLDLESSGDIVSADHPVALSVPSTALGNRSLTGFSVPEPNLGGLWLMWLMAVSAILRR